VIAKRKGVAARRGLKEARSRHASRWTRTGLEALRCRASGAVQFRELRRRDVSLGVAAKTAGSAHGPWRLANSPALAVALPNAYFQSLGLPSMLDSPA
jgi:RNA-directed DNA polymerase